MLRIANDAPADRLGAASRPRARYALLLGLTALTGLAGAASAATNPIGGSTIVLADAGGPGSSVVTEVVVTARHRSENLQSVPVSVAALGADFIKRTNTSNIAQIAQLAPSLSFTFFNARNANLNIRGLGNNIGLANDGIEPGRRLLCRSGLLQPPGDRDVRPCGCQSGLRF